jgi:hypothetical protein
MKITTVVDAPGLGAETRCVRKYMRGFATTPWGVYNCSKIVFAYSGGDEKLAEAASA